MKRQRTNFFVLLWTLCLWGCATKIDWRPFSDRETIWYQQDVSETVTRAELERCKADVQGTASIHACMQAKGFLLLPRQEAELLMVKSLQQEGLNNKEIAKKLRWSETKVSRYTDDRYELGTVHNLGKQPVEVLASLGKAGVDPLIAELRNSNPLVRRQAAQALGEIGDPRAVDPLIRILKEQNDLVLRHVVEALGKIGDPRAVPSLVTLLNGEKKPSHVRVASAEALGIIGGTEAVPDLCAALKADDWGLRSRAAESLGKIGDPRSVQPLIASLKDKDTVMRAYAVEALGEIGDLRAVEPLRTVAAQDTDKNVRKKAEQALQKIDIKQVPEGPMQK